MKKQSFRRLQSGVIKSRAVEGFTLVELLLVMALLAILASVVVTVLRPQEYLRRTRDSRRIQDVRLIADGLNIVRATQTNPAIGSSSVVYISVPDSSTTCANLTLPNLPSGWSYACAPATSYRNIDGTGWLPVNFTSSPGVQFSTLPVDEQNSATEGYYYSYVASSSDFAVASMLASDKRLREMALSDGGTDPGRFERGSDLKLWAQATGLAGWWPLDEGVNDLSGNGNNGTNNGATATSDCKVGGCYDFAAGTERIELSAIGDTSFDDLAEKTVMGWFNPEMQVEDGRLITKSNNSINPGWDVLLPAQHNVTYRMQYLGNYKSWNTGVLSPGGTWTFFAVSHDRSDVANDPLMYLDGSQISSLVESGSPSNPPASDVNEPLNIGNVPTGDRDYIGLLDEVRVYSRILSAKEIEAIYRAQR